MHFDFLIRPFAGLRPQTGRDMDVAAPPYDVLNAEEARAQAEGKPWSFLHISKAEIDFPPGTDPYGPEIYAKAAENLQTLVREGVLVRDGAPCYYVYRARMGAHVQTGLVVAASVAAYEGGGIKRHEFTRPDKEDDRVRQIDALNAQTGPVFLVHRPDDVVAQVMARVATGTPASHVTMANDVEHWVWVVDGADDIQRLSDAFNAMDALYIADGHHRSAAAARVCDARKAANANHSGDESYNTFLAVTFPADEMQVLDYNRVVRDLNGLSLDDFMARVKDGFEVSAVDAPFKPDRAQCFGMVVRGEDGLQWYRLDVKGDVGNDPVGRLDVSILAARILEPVLGIENPRTDKRIDFVGGIRGLGALETRLQSGEWAVAFSLYPTGLEQLMSVADSGEVMPPKSTWFEPKLADGLVSLVLD